MHKGKLQEVGLDVIGSCIGNNCRIGSGHVVYPARTIESDVVLITQAERRVITKNISFDESDHHGWSGELHEPLYRPDQVKAVKRAVTTQGGPLKIEEAQNPERTVIERMINRIGRM